MYVMLGVWKEMCAHLWEPEGLGKQQYLCGSGMVSGRRSSKEGREHPRQPGLQRCGFSNVAPVKI